jgi:hypothetical protein
MEWHRHRIHPQLWKALGDPDAGLPPRDPALSELAAWKARRQVYQDRRPIFSQTGRKPPWKH